MRYGAVIVVAKMTARMKQFKQVMKIGDKNIAERVIINFLRAGVNDIVMVTGYNADQLEKALKGFDITFIRNEDYENSQMFDSARLGLEHFQGKCDRLFFGPVDVPFFTDQTVTEMIRMMDRDQSIKVIVPNCEGRDGHPILIAGDAIPALLAHDGERGMRGAYESLPEGSVARVQVNDKGAIIGTDQRDDFRMLMDLHNERILHPKIKVTFASTTPFFGPGTFELLREIEECGNVRDACEKCGFSYSKAWTIIRNCEEKFGWKIVDRQPGGQTGGTARVTDKGKALLAAYEELDRELSDIAEERFRQLMKEHRLTGDTEQ